MTENSLKPEKNYAHKGRRRRRITDELFRCPCPLTDVGGVSCGALLWRSDLAALREHLTSEHGIAKERVGALSDTEISEYYINAATIPQPDITDAPEEPGESDGVCDYE